MSHVRCLDVFFSFLQPLPRVPKLYTPLVACPRCRHANDEEFRFCQQCGYVRRQMCEDPRVLTVSIDSESINQCLDVLSRQRGSLRYVKQKSSLERELCCFLSSCTPPKSMESALPRDILEFLVWKDRGGKTMIHQPGCPNLSAHRRVQSACGCPKRLAFGTVDALIGKLRAIFIEQGRGKEWHAVLNVGNPAADWSIKRYLSDVREEQLKARVVPQQAEPVFLKDLVHISRHIHKQLMQSADLSPTRIYVLARDQAIFKAMFFAADWAKDLLNLKTVDILRFPDNSGFLFNQLWSKSLRSGDAHVFALKRGTNRLVCPVQGIELYFSVCKCLGITLVPGFVFRSTGKSGSVSSNGLDSSAAQARLSVYISELSHVLSSKPFTLHGFRSGAAVSLAMAGLSLHEIMDHVGWKSSRTALHYIKLNKVTNPSGAASKLSDLDIATGETYERLNKLVGFSPAFVE